jgi:23S rRNA pseudouridine1911/1915/1917 synthase
LVTLLAEGKVRLNGERVHKKGLRLRKGEQIAVDVPPPDEAVRHEELGLQLVEEILHDDEHVLALAKPPGMVMHPVGRIQVNTLVQVVHWIYVHGPLKSATRAPDRIPRICHRLDRDTSGVVVLAKTPEARRFIQRTFDMHELEKEYLAVVKGEPSEDEGRIELALGRATESGIRMAVRPDGAPSLTTYRVLERFGPASSVRFRIHTGRQHQIRVHANAIGHPVLLDTLYGDGVLAWPINGAPVITRQALHSERLALAHPITKAPLELKAPVPADLRDLLENLEQGSHDA